MISPCIAEPKFKQGQHILITRPRFKQGQNVRFIGGTGTIKSYQPDVGTWSYAVKMELGPEPDFGRVGDEATVLLLEEDLYEHSDSFSKGYSPAIDLSASKAA